jgi:hypothetical protein
MTRGRWMALAVAATLAALAVVAILGRGDDEGAPPGSGSQGPVMLGEAVDLLPSETLRDWVSFADDLAVVSVAAERELPPPPGADPRLDEDYIGREVTLQVERTLWHRPGGPSVGDDFDMVVWGWTERSGTRRPFAVLGGARMEVGRRYLLPVTKIEGEWTPLGSGTILTLEGDTVTSDVPGNKPEPVAAAMKGRSLADARRAVNSAAPYPLAAKNAEVPAVERWKLVSRQQTP